MDGVILRRGGPGGGTDVSDTTATASDVNEGKYFYTAAGVKTLGTNPLDKSTSVPALQRPVACVISIGTSVA